MSDTVIIPVSTKPRQMPAMSRLLGRRLAKIGGGLALLLLLAALSWDAIELWNWAAFLEWKRQVGFVPFFVGLALLPLVGIPTTPLFLIAGATFSPAVALAGCGVSIALNLAISYWLANRWLRRPLRRQLRRWNVPWPEHDATQALQFLLIFRFTPGIPTFIKNYVSALSEITFSTYFSVSWVITFLYALGFVIMGDSLVNHSPGEAALGILLLVGAYFLVRRFRNRSRVRVT
jgi:uncharacterized membrane protein YdjX (TVP38/TMEM64 family)